ncbi:MAG: EamA family transporter [Paenibacillaceae bacterium]|jgi:drug/metabolite transporter (DMT)-like permease|nr:EamA family transporter [Paenibacillaceae bacterium]
MRSLLAQKWFSVAVILIGASSYGLLSPTIKLAFQAGYSEGDITSVQVTMGTLVMWVLVLLTKEARRNPFTGPWIRLALIGIFGLSLTTVFYNRTLSELDASLSIVLLFQFTWITIVMECFAQRRLPTRSQGAAIVIVMAGTVLSVNLLSLGLERFTVMGLLYGLASAFTYSLFLFSAGRVKSEHHPFLKSAWMLTAGLMVIYAVYPPQFLIGGADGATGSLVLWGLLLGCLGQVVPTIAFLIGIPRTGSSLAAMTGAMELPVAVIGAFLLLGESIASVQWLGMGLILAGVVLSEAQISKQKQTSEAK